MKNVRISLSRLGAVALTVLAATGGSVGCSRDDEPPPFELDLAAQLEADTGVAWDLTDRAESGEVRTMLPAKPVNLGSSDPEVAAKGFFTKYGAALGGTGNDKELASHPMTERDLDGLRFARYGHRAPTSGLQVFDDETIAAFTKEGELIYVQVGFHRGVDAVSTTPKLSTEAALRAARTALVAECGESDPAAPLDEKAVLGISAHNAPRLAYRVSSSLEAEMCHSPQVTLDANTGEILSVSSGTTDLEDPNVKGVHFYRKNNQADVKTIDYSLTPDGRRVLHAPALPATAEAWLPQVRTMAYKAPGVEVDIESKSPGEWDADATQKGAAVDAHYHTGRALEFFRDVLKRRGLDQEGIRDVLVVAHNNSSSNGKAAWGAPRVEAHSYKRGILEVINVGDGGSDRLPFTSYDVIVHELAHAITRNSSRLVYAYDSGALDESFSDVMAASADFWISRHAKKLSVPVNPTLIGENITVNGRGIRNMENPQAHAHPDHYDNRYKCAPGEPENRLVNDHCGVHVNSGIANRAWSLMALGGVHALTGVRVQGMGWERAALLWYNTITHLESRSTMRAAAEVMVARSLYYGPDALISAACAWHAVGLGDFRMSSFNTNMCVKLAAVTPRLSTSTCSGVPFGYVCQEGAPNAAYVCVNGSIASGVLCADSKKRCRKRNANDWTATYDLVNGLACE